MSEIIQRHITKQFVGKQHSRLHKYSLRSLEVGDVIECLVEWMMMRTGITITALLICFALQRIIITIYYMNSCTSKAQNNI